MALTDENGLVMPVTPMYGQGGGFGGGDWSWIIVLFLFALDELLDAVQVYNPKLYKSFLRKL